MRGGRMPEIQLTETSQGNYDDSDDSSQAKHECPTDTMTYYSTATKQQDSDHASNNNVITVEDNQQ